MTIDMNKMPDIISQIIRAKRANPEECVLFINQNLYDAMEEAGLVVRWKENHPGAIWMHRDICGLPVVINPKVELFSVVSQREARELIYFKGEETSDD